MQFFGLEIGDSSIKIVQLKKEPDSLTVLALGEAASPQPGISSKSEAQWRETAKAIKSLVKELKLKTKNAVVGLPESEVISRLIKFPSMKDREVRAALEFEVETFIPHPLDKIQMDYEIISRDENGKLLVFVVAALKETVEKYLKVLREAGVTPIALETPAVALARIFASSDSPVLIVELEGKYSNLIIGKQQNVFLTRSVPIGTESFVRAISVSLGLEISEAEGYCRTYGLKGDELEGKVKQALMPLFERLIHEVKKVIYAFNEEWRDNVGLLVFSGDGATIPEFTEETARILGIETQVAQPFAQVKLAAPAVIDVQKEGGRFSVALGLAARGLKS